MVVASGDASMETQIIVQCSRAYAKKNNSDAAHLATCSALKTTYSQPIPGATLAPPKRLSQYAQACLFKYTGGI